MKEHCQILVAVSGGVDSVVLLDKLYKKFASSAVKLAIVHVNHCLRGKESLRDERFVKGLARRYGCKIYVKKGGRGGISNLQNAARNIRYKFFLQTAKKIGANKIALAHHADDQAETMLLHLLRGCGLKGLSGMQEERELEKGICIIRPLLKYSKEELKKYARDHGLKFVEDSTNKTLKYTRNFIRHDVVPKFQAHNKNFTKLASETAKLIGDDDRCLDEFALACFKKCHKKAGGRIIINRRAFEKIHISIKRRLLRLAYAELTGNTEDILSDHIEKMVNISSSGKKKGMYFLPRGLCFIRSGNLLEIGRQRSFYIL